MKKSKRFTMTGALTVLFIVATLWFAWEWWQQTPKKTLGVRTDPKRELLARCLDKAAKDYERNKGDINSAPAPNFAQLATESFHKDNTICHHIYGA